MNEIEARKVYWDLGDDRRKALLMSISDGLPLHVACMSIGISLKRLNDIIGRAIGLEHKSKYHALTKYEQVLVGFKIDIYNAVGRQMHYLHEKIQSSKDWKAQQYLLDKIEKVVHFNPYRYQKDEDQENSSIKALAEALKGNNDNESK